MITTFLFDVGNVVWFYQPYLNRLHQRWAELSHLSYDDFSAQYLAFYKYFEINQKTLDDFVIFLHQPDPAPYWQTLTDIYNTSDFNNFLNQPILNLISGLKSVFRVGYLSNAENFFYQHVHQKLESNFDFGYSSWQLGLEKPNPEIYQKVLNLQNLQPSEAVFIDDIPANVTSAKSVGINSILFENNSQLLTELRKILFY
ncbi:MAG: HAD-IA family hydrolase [Candidatus Shapirobacteria bacterium]|nr:HAD-IA family hydrolase [Candidatus Shapirobacteria bacterium]